MNAEIEQVVAELRETAKEYRVEDRSVGIFPDHESADMLEAWATRIEQAAAQGLTQAEREALERCETRRKLAEDKNALRQQKGAIWWPMSDASNDEALVCAALRRLAAAEPASICRGCESAMTGLCASCAAKLEDDAEPGARVGDDGYMAVYERERKWLADLCHDLPTALFNIIVARLATNVTPSPGASREVGEVAEYGTGTDGPDFEDCPCADSARQCASAGCGFCVALTPDAERIKAQATALVEGFVCFLKWLAINYDLSSEDAEKVSNIIAAETAGELTEILTAARDARDGGR